MLLLVLAPFAAAMAQDEGSAIKGTLEAIDGEDRVPVAGVTISVAQDGTDIGSAVTDEAGEWLVVVPGAGAYQVTLDVTTLPEGVGPTDPEGTTLPEVTVREGQQKTVRFQLGPGSVSTVSSLERFVDLLVLGLKLGAIIAISAIGLSLIYGVTGLVNFSHGEMVTLGAVIAFFFHTSVAGPEWPLLIAAIPAILLGAGLGGGQELLLWRPLRRRGTGLIAMMVISIGLSFALRNLILILFKGEPRSFVDYAVQREVEFLGVATVPKNIVIVLTSVVILVLVGLFLERTKTGTAMRAVSDNKDLAESSGIDVNRVILTTWLVGGGLAAIGGIFLGVSEQLQFDMGFKLLLLIFAAVVLGGLGSAYGAMVGGFIVGVVVEVSTFWVATEFKTAVGLGVLILMLLLRPQGILGSRERIG